MAKEYAESHKLSFPIAYTNELKDKYYSSAYPTTLLIDRNGKIGSCRVGSIPDAKTFEKIVTTFMGDGYQERQLGYYTICANDGEKYIPDIEFTMISESGAETYNTGDSGKAEIFTDTVEDMKIQVTSVPEGYAIDGSGETSTGLISTYISLPVVKK